MKLEIVKKETYTFNGHWKTTTVYKIRKKIWWGGRWIYRSIDATFPCKGARKEYEWDSEHEAIAFAKRYIANKNGPITKENVTNTVYWDYEEETIKIDK